LTESAKGIFDLKNSTMVHDLLILANGSDYNKCIEIS
jgi:hypothetical protein